ncbi:hypothetical protein BDQ17DRAFT_1236801 [Cyathus striatus]|nr:hypothetical protein BDQ17DRAFT_1236801 [Cyathus striatus]
MKSLRKSLNGNKDVSRPNISTPLPLPSISKPPTAILPPQKVIRALASYQSQAPQELSFVKGDFFYVINDDTRQDPWYEAHNPISGARGLVPRAMFEEFSKHVPPCPTRPPNFSEAKYHSALKTCLDFQSSKNPVYYAIVLHDFEAEREDELDAKQGDAITVVAQSNREWFVAKPIGRLGRPGLIPVSFVEIHDPATGNPITDVEGLMDRGELPKVEEWKRAMLNYKQNSIALGVLDTPNRDSVASSPFIPQKSPHVLPEPPQPNLLDCLPEGLLLSADVVSFHFEMDEYWFRLDAVYQPYASAGETQLPPSKQLILFRVYNDFYDFQMSLLSAFPREGGKDPQYSRTLPFMPGPSDKVDDGLTASRRTELDEYVHGLCELSRIGQRYVLEHEIMRRFLAPKPGDIIKPAEPKADELGVILSQEENPPQEYLEATDKMAQLDVNGSEREGSDYGDEGYAASTRQSYDYAYNHGSERRPSNGSNNLREHTHTHQRAGSTSSFQNSPVTHPPHSRTHSRSNSPYLDRTGDYFNSQSRYPSNDVYQYPNDSNPSATSVQSQAMTGRSRSHSTATSNLNTPPISAANPQTAFVKIKIFDRLSDDLVAIRVHPKVTHAELMEKVQTRLGAEVGSLRYRNSVTNSLVDLEDDKALREWMEGTDKHVLYAQ